MKERCAINATLIQLEIMKTHFSWIFLWLIALFHSCGALKGEANASRNAQLR
jgi:hypothetical protein